MKSYPSIGRDNVKGQPFYVFDKLDGSNVRTEWNQKRGFWKFGSKTQLIDETGPLGALAIPLMKAQEDRIGSILRGLRVQEATCFFEFYGPSSFAGVHQWKEMNFQTVLLDVSLFKRGMLGPYEFVKTFGHKVSIPSLVHCGNVTDGLVQQVWDGTLAGVTFEGVVCKGLPLKNGYPPHMFKLKSKAWVDKVKSLYADPKMLAELL